MKKFILASFVSAFLAMTAPASAQILVDATDVSTILDAAKGIGSATLGKDSTGDPKIEGRAEGIYYSILFFGCTNGKDCDDIQFRAHWDAGSISHKDVNEWNSDNRFGKAYLYNDSVFIVMPVNIDYGVSKRNLEDSFSWWMRVVKAFQKDVAEAN